MLYELRCEVFQASTWDESPAAVETARRDHNRRVHLRAADPVLPSGVGGPDFLDRLLDRPWLLVVGLVVLYLLGVGR
ncbi:hypothetical protein ACWEQL_20125 [Kitasatospora sp. NPDC004240]